MGIIDRDYMKDDHKSVCDCAYCRGQREIEAEKELHIKKAFDVWIKAFDGDKKNKGR